MLAIVSTWSTTELLTYLKLSVGYSLSCSDFCILILPRIFVYSETQVLWWLLWVVTAIWSKRKFHSGPPKKIIIWSFQICKAPKREASLFELPNPKPSISDIITEQISNVAEQISWWISKSSVVLRLVIELKLLKPVY